MTNRLHLYRTGDTVVVLLPCGIVRGEIARSHAELHLYPGEVLGEVEVTDDGTFYFSVVPDPALVAIA